MKLCTMIERDVFKLIGIFGIVWFL